MGIFAALAPLAINAVGSLIGGRSKDKASQRALEANQQGFNFLRDSPLGTQYLPSGGRAVGMRDTLLGLGGDTAAAEGAFDNFLNSTGFQHALSSGSRAITGNRAARGILDSGSTGKGLKKFGMNLSGDFFNNYLDQLMQQSQLGLSAGGAIGGAASQAGANAAQIEQQRGQDRAGMIGDIGAGVGDFIGSGGFKKLGQIFGRGG